MTAARLFLFERRQQSIWGAYTISGELGNRIGTISTRVISIVCTERTLGSRRGSRTAPGLNQTRVHAYRAHITCLGSASRNWDGELPLGAICNKDPVLKDRVVEPRPV